MTTTPPVTIRRGTPADTRACHNLLWQAATDLGLRRGTELEGTADDWWTAFGTTHEHLATTAAEWWVAEPPDSPGDLTGYARSTRRGGLLELTEFFVRPGLQGQGLGRELLERAFPAAGADVRSIIATTDERALARYYRTGVVARFPFLALSAEPADAPLPTGLQADPIGARPDQLGAVADIEREVIHFPRGDAEVRSLLRDREGHLYRRDGRLVGLSFVGVGGAGPIAALDPRDLPDILLHVEARARAIGVEKLELEVPSVAAVAVRHLLGRGFRISPWMNLLMSDREFGRFDRYVAFSPPVVL